MTYKTEIKHWIVYKITSPSGRIYVGRTFNYSERLKDYKYNQHIGQKLLYHSMCKYGFDTHKFEIVDEFDSTLDYAGGKEIFWVRSFMSNYSKWPQYRGMNLTDGGEGMLGFKHSEETKQNHREFMRKNPNRHSLGKKHSEETRRKISAAKKGKPSWSKGKKAHPETLKNLIMFKKGQPSHNKGKKFEGTPEERKLKFGAHNIGNSYNKGRKHTPEMIERSRLARTGVPQPKLKKPVLKYDINGSVVGEYGSVFECRQESGLSSGYLCKILKNGNPDYNGFSYKYKL